MRTIFIFCGVILLAGAVFAWRAMRMPSEFGSFTGAPKAEITDLVQRPKDFVGKAISVQGLVREQCQSMGCYFFMPASPGKLRVDLQEIAMHAPMREGHRAEVEGQMVPYGDGYQLAATAVRFE
jgi:hypothetical protein